MSFVDDVDKERERNSPVRTAVKANSADIQDARAAGKPLNAVYRTLTRKGHLVGKGYSSFRNAVRYLDEHGWPATAPVPSQHVPISAPAVQPDTTHGSRDRFVDNRFDSDF